MNPNYCRKLHTGMLFTFSLILMSAFGYSQVKTWEGTIAIPTYKWEEDVNPKFWAMEGGARGAATVRNPIVYPYTMQDHLSRKLENVTYKAIFLENEYLKIICLPELGGRLHSVYDKTTNREMFHKNNVIKPSMIAMRGGFISGGVEWNAGPQVHTVTCLSPVDVISGTNNDGSAWIEISNLEKSLRTQWTVRVTLHPGKAYLDEDIRIANPAEAMNPYYFWNCTAFPQLPGTRFIYPMTLGTDHYGLRFFNWPVNDGKDLSWTKNYADAASIFAVNCEYDFFGAYDVDLDQGIIQVADHNEHSGKKAWTWGQGEYGRVCQKNLTDSDGNYIEVQSGPLPTQSDYGHLAPKGQISWKEYWYPVHGLGDGFEYASDKVAFRTERKGGLLEIRILATEKFPQSFINVTDGNNQILSKQLDLSPEKPALVSLNLPANKEVTILVKSSSGEELARYQSPLPMHEVIPPKPPSYIDKPDNQLTTEEMYLLAQKYDRSLDRKRAREYYSRILEIDSLYLPALRDLAIMDFEAAQYDKAAVMLSRALEQIPNDDGLAWYFLGLCRIRQNRLDEAAKCGYKASRCLGTESIGFDLVGRSCMLQHKTGEALSAFDKACRANENNEAAFHHYMVAMFVSGQKEKALALARARISTNPTELVPRALEAVILNDPAGFVSTSRKFVGEFDFELLGTGLFFSELGLHKEASWILENACINGVELKEQDPLVQYHLAFLYSLTGDKDKSSLYLSRAAANSRDFIYASRPETIDALEYAVKQNPSDALARYQLGNLFGNFGRLDEAASEWESAVKINPSLSIPWRNLGWYYWTIRNDRGWSEMCFQNAIKNRPSDQTLYRDLAGVLVDEGKRSQAISLLENMPLKGIRRSDITIDLAQACLESGRYDESIKVLMSTPYFVNWEGSSLTWFIFNQSHIRKGIDLYNQKKYKEALIDFEAALTFPENLGVGKSTWNGVAEGWYWKGKALQSLGRSGEAVQAWKSGSNLSGSSERPDSYENLCRMMLR